MNDENNCEWEVTWYLNEEFYVSTYPHIEYSNDNLLFGYEEVDGKLIAVIPLTNVLKAELKKNVTESEVGSLPPLYQKRQLFDKFIREKIPVSELKKEWKKMIQPDDEQYFDEHINQTDLEKDFIEYKKMLLTKGDIYYDGREDVRFYLENH